jgi:hypothetical protein
MSTSNPGKNIVKDFTLKTAFVHKNTKDYVP